MVLKQWLGATTGALVLATTAAPAYSVPYASQHSYGEIPGAHSSLKRVAYRICTTGRVRHCRWADIYGPRGYGYRRPSVVYLYGPNGDYIPSYPEDYPVGTPRWWNGMDREDRGGNR
jgi:hypothetical protein